MLLVPAMLINSIVGVAKPLDLAAMAAQAQARDVGQSVFRRQPLRRRFDRPAHPCPGASGRFG